MALVVGNMTSYCGKTDSADRSLLTVSHNQDDGSDRHLVVIVFSSHLVTAMTYGSVAMTHVRDNDAVVYEGTTSYSSVWELDSPLTGSNDIIATNDADNWEDISLFASSYTGCGGVGSTDIDLVFSVGNTIDLDVSSNSRIIATVFPTDMNDPKIECPLGIELPQIDYIAVTQIKTFGSVSGIHSSGTITTKGLDGDNGAGVFALLVTEIKEAVSISSAKYYLI